MPAGATHSSLHLEQMLSSDRTPLDDLPEVIEDHTPCQECQEHRDRCFINFSSAANPAPQEYRRWYIQWPIRS